MKSTCPLRPSRPFQPSQVPPAGLARGSIGPRQQQRHQQILILTHTHVRPYRIHSFSRDAEGAGREIRPGALALVVEGRGARDVLAFLSQGREADIVVEGSAEGMRAVDPLLNGD